MVHIKLTKRLLIQLSTVAGALWVIRLIAPGIPFTAGGQNYTLGQAHSLCTSAIGNLAQAFSNTAATNCANVASWYDLLNVVTLTAVVCTILAVIVLVILLGSERNNGPA